MRNRDSVVSIMVIIVISFARLSYARSSAEDLPQVEKLFMEEKYERVVTEAAKLIDAGAHGREELFYLKALSQIKLHNFSGGRDTFRYMVERYPRGKRAFDGYVGIGDAYFLEGKTADAITAYNEVLAKFPDHKNSGVVQEKLASAYEKIGLKEKAKQAQPVPDAPKVDAARPVDGTGEYYVQAGYFKSKDNAQKLNEGLKQKGYDSYMSVQTKAGFTFYRVKVGRFNSKSEAEIVSRKLKADGYKTKVCR